MLYSLSGKLIMKKSRFAVIEANGFGFKIFISSRTFRKLPKLNSRIKLFCYIYHYQNGTELYGFFEEKEREIFELLNSISGVGPKAALKILDEIKIDNLLNAIRRGQADILTKAGGIGKKKATRIILELSDKIKQHKINIDDSLIEVNSELEEILKSLGYKRKDIYRAINQIPSKAKTLQERIRFALKIISHRYGKNFNNN